MIDEAEKNSQPAKDNVEPFINTDGRSTYDWKSKYPDEARKEIRLEAIYIGVVLILSLLGLFFNWCGYISHWLMIDLPRIVSFENILFYFFSGLLGGTIFGIKYFYRVVARGYWAQDRRYWRLFSPWISSCISLVIRCMVITGYISSNQSPSTATGVCIGFIAGYFADEAVGKMSEVANALFGSSSKVK